jgi:aspartokinase-like uncharacterized kinase
LAVASQDAAAVDTVVKVGGGLLATVAILDAVLAVVAAAAASRRLLVICGGGPFADAVRAVDRRIGLPDTAAHWMAVLAMDQYAHLVAARLAGAMLVADPRDTADAVDRGRIPVLAPSRWLRDRDPEDGVDPYFPRALRSGVVTRMIAADRIDALRSALSMVR